MSDLTATQCGCSRQGGSSCSNILWIVLILSMCNHDNDMPLFGNGRGDNDGCQCILLLLLLTCCGGCNSMF